MDYWIFLVLPVSYWRANK